MTTKDRYKYGDITDLQRAGAYYAQLLALMPADAQNGVSLDEHLENVLKIKEWLKENDK